MKLKLEKIRLNQLDAFVKSPRFKEFEIIPISRNRVKSYLNNPHAHPDDVVLYLGFLEEKLVAFRTLFADVLSQDSQKIRFGWCSGNWVHPEFRRKGFSEQLLHEAYSDWDQKLMFTNYAPNSEKLYLKTGWFKTVHQFEGVRAYLFPKINKLKADGKNTVFSRFLYSFLDFILELFSKFRLLFFRKPKPGKYQFEIIGKPDSNCYQFLERHRPNHAFQRYEAELKWVFSFPWLSNSEINKQSNYPFSSFSNNFRYQTIKIFSGDNLAGFCIFSVRDKHLKTLYFAGSQDVLPDLFAALKYYSKKHKIEVLTVYKKELAEYFLQRKFPFLHVKKYGQKIYSTFEQPESSHAAFQDGDGDVIFT